MENQEEYVVTESRSLGNVLKRTNLSGRYCSFQAFYGDIIARLEEEEKSEYISEDMYFHALQKLELIVRGSCFKATNAGGIKAELPTLHISESEKFHPPKGVTDILLERMYTEPREDEPVETIYAVKRGTFGFNCADAHLLLTTVTTPVVRLLSEVNDEITDIYNISVEKKAMLKELGLGIPAYRKMKIIDVKRRLL